MKKKRLVWAREHRLMSVEDWSNCPGEKFDHDCVVERVKHPLQIMVWSVISAKGIGRLYIVQGTMRQDRYKQVLETRLLPQLQEWFPEGEKFMFKHDSPPCHKARSVKKFLADHNIPILPWPGSSPDRDPI
ncbi:putative transposase like protein [Danaus plexippus plexippus]|uniref:Transposase like protein n=1 Tax=Danaus plexippus plexippus TaxID=278856 RepID=A0A212FNB7_DANPL|nr:putative transposase like protein [Danaus plexippus plexippus]